MSEDPILLELVRRASRRRALSRKTENAYVNHIRRFRSFHGGRDLAEIGAAGIDDFLQFLRTHEKLADSTRNQALSALAFLYRDVFRQTDFALPDFRHTKPKTRAPVVFTREEAREVLSQMSGGNFLAAALMYGSGLRLSEAVALRVGDLDLENRTVVVRDARSGRPTRRTVLPRALVPRLARHLRSVRYLYEDDCALGYGRAALPPAVAARAPQAAAEWRWQFVFPSPHLSDGAPPRRAHLTESSVQKAFAAALGRAQIRKAAYCQTFRYSFAARLFEKNCDIRRIQTLLGHKNLKTTAVYLELARSDGEARRAAGN